MEKTEERYAWCVERETPWDLPGELTPEELEGLDALYLEYRAKDLPFPEINRRGTLLALPEGFPIEALSPFLKTLTPHIYGYQYLLISEVRLPKGLKAIPPACFSGCDWLDRVEIPDSVEQIGANAFSGCCGLRSVRLPNRLKVIPRGCFTLCTRLETVRLPKKLEFVGNIAFWDCRSLRTPVRFGPRLWGIIGPFGDAFCSDDPAAAIPDTASFYNEEDDPNSGACRRDTYRFLQPEPLPPRAPRGGIYYESGKQQDTGFEWHGRADYFRTLMGQVYRPILPRNVSYAAFRKAFAASQTATDIPFTGAILSEGVEELPRGAFAGLEGFRSIRLPSTLKRIRKGAFKNCRDLEYINLWSGLEIEPGAFDGCAHMVWVDDAEVRGAPAQPDPEELGALVRLLYDTIMPLPGFADTREQRYLKYFIPRLRVSDRDPALAEAAAQWKELARRINKTRKMARGNAGDGEAEPRLVSVVDPALREAVRACIRYELRYLRT